MAKSHGEIQRLKEQIRNIDALIRELENKDEPWAREELRRQRQLKKGLEAELKS